MNSYPNYVNYKIKYLKLKNNKEVTNDNFIFDNNIDYNLKYNKYKEKIRNLIGGFRIESKDNSISLNENISKYTFEFLDTDSKLKLLETFVTTHARFTEYLNEVYFSPYPTGF